MLASRFEVVPERRRRTLRRWGVLALLCVALVLALLHYQQGWQRHQLSLARTLFASELRQARMCWLVRGYDSQRYTMDCDRAEQLSFSDAGWPVGGNSPLSADKGPEGPCEQIWRQLMDFDLGSLKRAAGQDGIDSQGFASDITTDGQCRYFLSDNPRLSFRYDMGSGELE